MWFRPSLLALCAALLLTGCEMRYLLFGFPEPTVVAKSSGPIELRFREGAGGLVLLTGNVNGLGDTDFILDTGAPVTVLLDGPATKALQLDTRGARKLGADDNPAAPVGVITPGFKLDFGGVALTDLTAVVIPQHTLPCQDRFAAINFGGVIGADLFRRFVVEIDHARKIVRLHEPAKWQPSGGAVVPLTFESGHIFADFVARVGDARVPVHMHIDTGKNEALSFIVGSKPELVMPTEGETRKACFVAGTVETKRGAPVALDFGGVTASAVTPNYEQRDAIRLGKRQGAIGIGLMKQFVTTFDYQGKRMVLQERVGAV